MFENGIFSYELSREGMKVYLKDDFGARVIPIEKLGIQAPLCFDFDKEYKVNGDVVYIDSVILSRGYELKVIYQTFKSKRFKECNMKQCVQS